MSPLNITQQIKVYGLFYGCYKVMSNIPKMGQLNTVTNPCYDSDILIVTEPQKDRKVNLPIFMRIYFSIVLGVTIDYKII